MTAPAGVRPTGVALSGVPSAVSSDQVDAALRALGLPDRSVVQRVEIAADGVWLDLVAPATVAGVRRIVEVRLHLPLVTVPHEDAPPPRRRPLRDDDPIDTASS